MGDTDEDVRIDKKMCSEDINRIKLALDGLKWWNILNTEINYSIPLKRESFYCFVVDEMRLTVDIK